MKILFIIYDNESSRHVVPLGCGYIAAYLVKHGYDVDYFNQDAYHYSEKELYDYLKDNHYDVVGLGFIGGYSQHAKVLKISEAINSLKERPKFVLGGHGPSPIPEYFMNLTKADAVVIGEGEVTFLEYIKAIEGGKDLSTVDGLVFRGADGRIIINKRRAVLKNIDLLPWPYLDKLPMEYYLNSKWPPARPMDRVMHIIFSRGCYYNCNFCYRMEEGIRYRNIDDIVAEIKFYKEKYRISYINFQDELLMGSKKVAMDFCGKMIAEDLQIRWTCNGRLNVAVPEVLLAMKKAGCVFINYGIESFDNESLRLMDKKQTEEEIIKGIENTQACGIKIGFNLIFGNIGDTKESLRKSVDFFIKYNDFAQLRTIRPVTPYPGSKLYEIAIERGLLTGPEDFYQKHKNSDMMTVNLTNMPDKEFYHELLEANKIMLNLYYRHQEGLLLKDFNALYSGDNYNFRGPRHE